MDAGPGPERPSERGAGPERPSERGAGPERPSERGAGPVEDVITTAIALVTGRLAPREAVTILATLAPRAVGAAPALLESHPDQAAARAAVLATLAAEVGTAEDDPRQRARVVGDLMEVARALGHSGGV